MSETGVGRGLCANVHAEQSTGVTLVYWDEKDVRNEVGSVASKDYLAEDDFRPNIGRDDFNQTETTILFINTQSSCPKSFLNFSVIN